MGLTLEQVVPWGRSLEEYIRMFALAPDDLRRHILDCAGGPASFNAEMTDQGHQVISCDPIYQFSATDIEQRIQDTWAILKDKVSAHQNDYVWDQFASPEALGAARLESMQQFLQDFPAGLKKVSGEPSPYLPTVMAELQKMGYQVQIQPVSYEFQKGANQVLKIYR
jgi:hypothetical protein